MTNLADRRIELLHRRLAEKGIRDEATVNSRAISVDNSQSDIPLAHIQRGLWYHQRLAPESWTYNHSFLMMPERGLPRKELADIFTRATKAHSTFRTRYPASSEGIPRQEVVAGIGPEFDDVEVPDEALGNIESFAESVAHQRLTRPFDLETDAALRVTFANRGSSVLAVVITMHHICADGISIGAFLESLSDPDRLIAEDVAYGDFARWQREFLGDADSPSPESARQLDFWEDHLADIDSGATLPSPSPLTGSSGEGSQHRYRVPEQLWDDVTAYGRRNGVSAHMLFQAAVGVALARATGAAVVPMGTVVDLRERPELADVVGFFANTLVLKADTRGNPAFGEFVSEVARSTVAALDHRDVPFDWVVHRVNPARTADSNPIFRTVVSSAARIPDITLCDVVTAVREPAPIQSKFDLAFLMLDYRDGGAHVASVTWDTRAVDSGTAQALLDSAIAVLAQGVRQPMLRLDELTVFSAAGIEVSDEVLARYLPNSSGSMDSRRVRLADGFEQSHLGALAASCIDRFDALRVEADPIAMSWHLRSRIESLESAVGGLHPDNSALGFRCWPAPEEPGGSEIVVEVPRGLLDEKSWSDLMRFIAEGHSSSTTDGPGGRSFLEYLASQEIQGSDLSVLDDADMWLDVVDRVGSEPITTDIQRRGATETTEVMVQLDSQAFDFIGVRTVRAVFLTSTIAVIGKRFASDSILIELDEPNRRGALRAAGPVGWIRRIYPVVIDLTESDPDALAAELDSLDTLTPMWPTVVNSEHTVGAFDAPTPTALVVRWDFGGPTPVRPTTDRTDVPLVEFGIQIDPEQTTLSLTSGWFDAATVRSILATAVQALQGAAADRARDTNRLSLLPELPASDRERLLAMADDVADVLPLSPLQEGLLFHLLDDAGTGGSNYSTQNTLVLEGTVDVDRLRRAVADVVDLFPNVAARFVPLSVGYVQIIPRRPQLDFRATDLRPVSAADEASVLRRDMDRDTDAGFDLAGGPLARVALITTREDRHHLVLTAEHILLDGWSIRLILLGILRLYRGDDPAGIVSATSFRTYLEWVRAQDESVAESTWREELAEVSNPTSVITPGITAKDAAGECYSSLGVSLTADLRQVARDAGVTFGGVLEFAWALVLRRMTNSDDVAFGTVISGRPPELDGIENTVGLLFNTVPIRVRFDAFGPVADHLKALHAYKAKALRYPYVSLSTLLRMSGHRNLFDTLFVVQNLPVAADGSGYAPPQGGPLRVADEWIHDTTHYPLSLAAMPGEHDVSIRAIYRGVDRQVADEYVNRFLAICRRIAVGTSEPVGRLSILDGRLDERVLENIRRPGRSEPSARDGLVDVVDLFTAVATRLPQETALVTASGSWTYSDLYSMSNRFAHLLISRGAGLESRVALILPRSNAMVVGILGTMNAYAAYVPVDPDYPQPRISTMIEDARPSVVVVCESTRDRVAPDGPYEVIDLDSDRTVAELEKCSDASPQPSEAARIAGLDRLAYIMFTSGSTGRPKGVVVPVAGLSNMYANHAESVFSVFSPAAEGDISHRAKIALTTTFSFDASWEQLLWMLAGHEVHLIDEELRKDPVGLLHYMDDVKMDGFDVTPTFGDALVGAGLLERDRSRGVGGPDATGVTFVSLGGEEVNPVLWQAMRAAQGVHAYNFYGPTECTINALVAPFAEHTEPVIGGPIRGIRAFILDGDLQPAAVGVTGELYLTGVGLARGYHDRPGLTAGTFVACPFTGDGGVMYRTGDLARYRRDGAIEFGGRSDGQVKVRGYRVETGEITKVLLSAQEVGQAVVMADAGNGGATTLIAYLVATGDEAAPDIDEVRQFLVDRLPAFMVPALMVWVDALPYTLAGKLDASRLPSAAELLSQRVGREPDTKVAELVCAAYADVLDVDRVYLDDDFFELGGHSLLVVKLVARLDLIPGLEVNVRQVYSAPTPASLLNAVADEHTLRQTTRLRESDSRTIFCLPPAGGIGWAYYGMLPHLHRSLGVVVLQDPGLTDSGAATVDFDELVEQYRAQIDELSPTGPLTLIGWSFGGHVAHRIAINLLEAGAEVDLVLMDPSPPLGALDADDPQADWWLGDPTEYGLRTEAVAFLAGVSGVALPADVGADEEALLTRLTEESGFLSGYDRAALEAIIETYVRNSQTMRSARSGLFDGRALLVSATADKTTDLLKFRKETWQRSVTDLTVADVPLGHLEIGTSAGWKEIAATIGEFVLSAERGPVSTGAR